MDNNVPQRKKLDIGVIYQDKPHGLLFYRYQLNGSRKAVSLGTDDIEMAEKIARAKFMPIVKATSVEVVAGHVSAAQNFQKQKRQLFLCNAWEEYSHSPDKATPATVSEENNYESTLNHFIACVNVPTITLDEITHHHAEAFVTYLKKQEIAVDTHNRKIKRLRRIFKVLKEYYRGENPFASATLLRKAREEHNLGARRLSFTKEQEQRLLEELDNPARRLMNKEEIKLIYLIGMFTGQRMKDCVLLRWSSVDMNQRRIEVIQSLVSQ